MSSSVSYDPRSIEAINAQYALHARPVYGDVPSNKLKKSFHEPVEKTGLRSFTSNAYGRPIIDKQPAKTLFDHFEFPLPPSSNTGAQTQAPLVNRSLIDWFGFTSFSSDVDRVYSLLGIEKSLFSTMPSGGMGYRSSLSFGSIRIYMDGSPGMGIHVEMSGTGCREFEAYHDNCNPWLRIFNHINNLQHLEVPLCKVTRLDLATDTVDGGLRLSALKEAIAHGEIRSRFKSGRTISKFTVGRINESSTGESIYFGSPASRLQVRFYDKAAEQGLVGVEWVRAEIQLRDERAFVAVSLLANEENIGSVSAGIFNNYISFINLDHTRRENCTLKDWWYAWLVNTNKLLLTVQKKTALVFDTINHLRKQYAPSLAMLWEVYGPQKALEWLEETVIDGVDRLSSKHHRIIGLTRALCPLPAF